MEVLDGFCEEVGGCFNILLMDGSAWFRSDQLVSGHCLGAFSMVLGLRLSFFGTMTVWVGDDTKSLCVSFVVE